MKDVKKAYGICPASMTIWNDDETYNKKGMEKYLRWLIDQGAQSISVCGSTGENIAMNINEQLEIIDHTVRFLDGEVPVIVGSGTYSTKNTIIMSQAAEKAGADGVMLILPFYLHPYKEAVKRHFREIRKNLDIDIMVYNNPWFAGYELNPHEVKELVDDGTDVYKRQIKHYKTDEFNPTVNFDSFPEVVNTPEKVQKQKDYSIR